MARKGAFNDDDLDDIDDLLPPSVPAPQAPPLTAVPDAPRLPADTTTDAPAITKTKKTPVKPPAAHAEPTVKRPRAATARAKVSQSVPEAHVAGVVAEVLRQLTHTEKQQRGEGRSYGAVVLDAIETFETELQAHFATVASAKPAGRLFKRVDAGRPRRRRHSEPQVKIALSGIIADDMAAIDDLVETWQAGSRSALVDQALKLYLADDIARVTGAADDQDEHANG
ncbi:hypothetical protein [Nocardia jejuensis]|uniref:hypothetical protein n=1 Tax=Nocardia jejuensis TaxID=328049 RepID=UPI000B02C9F1|nr:hypothetical protein [Nocardia jejuensis]